MTRTIEEFVGERNIPFLLHFTKASNLDSIFLRGLVTRDTLVEEGYKDFNDGFRHDGTDAVCLSIAHPNYRMFYPVRLRHIEEHDTHLHGDWVVLVIRKKALWELQCAFCATNAASATVSQIPLEERMSLNALKLLYTDWEHIERSTLHIPDHYPTHPEAEVLMLDGVPVDYIFGVGVYDEAARAKLSHQYPRADIRVKPTFFSYRSDWALWKGN